MNKWADGIYNVDTLNKGMIDILVRIERNGTGFHHTSQNSVQLQTYALFISGISCLILLE
jgi:hypothetical protein